MNRLKFAYTMLYCILLIVTVSCTAVPSSKKPETVVVEAKDTMAFGVIAEDSIALLELTKRMLQWAEQGRDFVPLPPKMGERRYRQLDLEKHKNRLIELRSTKLFSEQFIDNYNRIAKRIDKEMKENRLICNEDELSPFGTGASPWYNCQNRPDNYVNKIAITDLKLENLSYVYRWNLGEGISVATRVKKDDGDWKIAWLEGFDYHEMVDSFRVSPKFAGRWKNEMVSLSVGDSTMAFEYHGQCVYFYPIKKISDTEFDMIWARKMDCKFDNGTARTFGLSRYPKVGKRFANFTMEGDALKVQYYYPEWIDEYRKDVQQEVFTDFYNRIKKEEY